MNVGPLLALLTGVRKTGDDRWLARCPAHDDRSPSLSLKELSDGRVLLHCFAGCETSAVLAAVGLTMGDLFPEKLATGERHFFSAEKQPFEPLDVLKILAREALVAAIAAGDVAGGKRISPTDADRCATASARIFSALDAVESAP